MRQDAPITDIAAFLTARLDEREALAKATTPVPTPGRWKATRDKHAADDAPLELIQGQDQYDPDCDDYSSHTPILAISAEWQPEAQANLRFIAANDPASVLADVAAKREVLRLHAEAMAALTETRDAAARETPFAKSKRTFTQQRYTGAMRYADAFKLVLEHMTTAYADHPDYDQSWRP